MKPLLKVSPDKGHSIKFDAKDNLKIRGKCTYILLNVL